MSKFRKIRKLAVAASICSLRIKEHGVSTNNENGENVERSERFLKRSRSSGGAVIR